MADNEIRAINWDVLKVAFEDGATYRELGKAAGVSYQTVFNKATKDGWERKRAVRPEAITDSGGELTVVGEIKLPNRLRVTLDEISAAVTKGHIEQTTKAWALLNDYADKLNRFWHPVGNTPEERATDLEKTRNQIFIGKADSLSAHMAAIMNVVKELQKLERESYNLTQAQKLEITTDGVKQLPWNRLSKQQWIWMEDINNTLEDPLWEPKNERY